MDTKRASIAAVLVAGACLLATLRSADARAPSEQQRDSEMLMKELSSDFNALEKAIRAKNTEDISSTLAGFRTVAPRMRTLEPAAHAELRDEFDRQVERFGALLDEIGALSAKSESIGAVHAFDELRATCVSCHVKFRSGNEERGDFPARANTVTGTISLRDADGEAREDRSWVLVFLDSIGRPSAPEWRRGPARLSQKLRQFQPRVLPVVVGTTIEFPNDDSVFHNVFSLSKAKPFDLGLYEPGRTASVSMDHTGLVKVYCNIHPDMNASIVVLANPWFALTDREGRFVICNVPAGEYTLRAWNDLGAEASQKLALGAGGDGPVVVPPLPLKESLRVVRHNDKFGRPYSDKY